jgi:modulator of FtsH protease HflC
MRLNLAGGILAALIIVGLIIAYSAMFTVYQTRQALVTRLGQPVRIITEPGLNFKVPLIDSVIYIDKRILDLENPAQEVIASVCVPKIRFCNNGDEDRRGQVAM